MGQIVVNVGSFDLTSHNGNTAYSSLKKFDIPANAGITKCVATFAVHVNTGSFQGKSFSLGGAQAHPNTPWPTSGIELNPALLSTGENSFKAAVKSQAGLSARWAIGDIYLTITYNDVGGGGGTTDPGTISISKTSLTAGEDLTVSVTGASGGVYRDVYIQKMPSTANILSVVQGHGSGAGSWTVAIPESWCATLSPDDPSFEVRIYMVSYIAGGAVVGDGAKMLTVNVPASAVPTIGAFTATRDANGVDASITNYVQNYSKVSLLMGDVAGALGSSIQSFEITGAGFSVASPSAAFGPFAQTGDITFTAKLTDTRGRTAARTVTINVLSYGPVAFSNPEAWRSSDAGVKNQKGTYCRLKSGVSYSSLDSQNSVTLKGRVYPKGGTVPAYTSMAPDTPWITGGGLLLVTKTYIAQMIVQDKITSRTMEFTIPTKKTGISIMAGMQGIAFGKSVEIPGVAEFGWPVIAPGLAPNPNILHDWDFRNPVNQRGLSAASGGGYWLDRWRLLNTTGATYTYNSTSGLRAITTTATITMSQYIENPNAYAGKTVTLSVDIYSASVTAECTIRLWHNGATHIGALLPINNGDTGIKSITATIPNTGLTDLSVVFYNYAGNDVRIKSVKLELGTVSTLHLDPPMDHAIETNKCRRFYIKMGVVFMPAISTSATMIRGCLTLPVAMRVVPTLISIEGGQVYKPGSAVSAVTDIVTYQHDPTSLLLQGTTTGLTAWQMYQLYLTSIELSSDL